MLGIYPSERLNQGSDDDSTFGSSCPLFGHFHRVQIGADVLQRGDIYICKKLLRIHTWL